MTGRGNFSPLAGRPHGLPHPPPAGKAGDTGAIGTRRVPATIDNNNNGGTTAAPGARLTLPDCQQVFPRHRGGGMNRKEMK